MRVLACLLVLCSGHSIAGTITTSAGEVFTVATTDCADVIAGFNAAWKAASLPHRGVSCSENPVAVGSFVLQNTAFHGNGVTAKLTYTAPITVVSAPPRVVTLDSLNTAVVALQSAGGGSSEPFDYTKATALFSFFFSFIVGVWFFCKNIGLVINAVRNW